MYRMLLCATALTLFLPAVVQGQAESASPARQDTIRFATFNVAMNRRKAGALLKELESGESKQAWQIAHVIR